MIEKLLELIFGKALTKNQKSGSIALTFALIFLIPTLVSQTSLTVPSIVLSIAQIICIVLVITGIYLLVKEDKD